MRKKLKSNRIILLGLLLWMIPLWQVFGQDIQIQGKVTDATTGEALPGVSISVKGAVSGTTTNIDGVYNIKVPTGSVLIFSFVGYVTEEKTVTGAQTIDVIMTTDVAKLGEVVVIGYGTVKKSDATGAVNVVSSKDFNRGVITSPQDLLIGKSSGVVITSGDGAPGSAATIRIRGGSSMSAS
ncbi:MAG TPA: carboxypeptidase-like regulatory domain-containing protein, partial [Bacteroidales bacterium]